MQTDCIFCKIVAGQIPSCKVYEDADTLAFMDIGPVVKGHTLVIPKQHWDPITQTPDETLAKVIAVVRKVAQAQMKGLAAEGVNVSQANGKLAGQEIPHIHFHVIPRFRQDGFARNWIPGKYEDPAEMQSLASRIRDAIQ